ncbi:MAG: hypothetical protein WAP03_18820 [Methylorubrum rhodinum]|uniref:hypothetical protein n=1 Tax=Methylorubrum rhodinum TaxID=29428 RepID=UPI003BB1A9BB
MSTSDRRDPVRGVNLVLLSDGREIHLDDIATAAQGQAILDGLDGAILTIEDQLAHAVPGADPSWRKRAEMALKRKRRQRPALQQRIGVLRRAERQAEQPQFEPGFPKRDGRRRAFIDAATELLPPETVTEIWARAAEQVPVAFAAADGGDA